MTGRLPPRGVNKLADQVRDAVGASDTEEVEVLTPQFERRPGTPPPKSPPSLPSMWNALRAMTIKELRAIGCGLALFPAEWYEHVPEGFKVVTINGHEELFRRGVTDKDRRFGLLSFGVLGVDSRANFESDE